jgi:uncharacterized protein (TIGR02391 family)
MPEIDTLYIQKLQINLAQMQQTMREAMLNSYKGQPTVSQAAAYREVWLEAKARIETLRAAGIMVPNLYIAADLQQWLKNFFDSYASPPGAWVKSESQMIEHFKVQQKLFFGPITEPLELAFKKYHINDESPNELIRDIKSKFAQHKPSLAETTLDGLHQKIRVRCEQLFNDGYLAEAVLAAMKVVEDELRIKTKADTGCCGLDLVNQAMPEKSPLLTFSKVDAEQKAAHFLFRGAVGFIRNPQAHRFIEIDDKQEAIEQLAFASMLMRMLDRATVTLPPTPA